MFQKQRFDEFVLSILIYGVDTREREVLDNIRPIFCTDQISDE